MEQARKIVIIGGGIAGLCTAVYARKCGYDVEVFEMQETAGGLAMSWRRGDYTFETCLHWLLGCKPTNPMYSQWREIFDIDKLTFVAQEEYVRVETQTGEGLSIYTDIDRMETDLVNRAPQDVKEIRSLARAARRFARMKIPDPTEPRLRRWIAMLNALPYLPLLRHWSKLTAEEYSKRFKHPLLRAAFKGGESEHMSALAFLFSLAWMSVGDASYPIGGSQAVIRLVVSNLLNLGGRLRLRSKVAKILVERDIAVGVQLDNGEIVKADWVISAADGHGTIYGLLGGQYADSYTDKVYHTLESFPSYLQVSLGIARNLSQQPRFVSRLLDKPLDVDAGTRLSQVAFRFFHFDPTFAPAGKTAVTCFMPTYNFEFWNDLCEHNPTRYRAEKQRIADAVIAILEATIPDIREAIEVTDVSTPATVIRFTGNWKGSMEGWLLTPKTGFKALRKTLPRLQKFLMVGQWVMPGGGLPSGLMTARSATQAICKHDKVAFLPEERLQRRPLSVTN